MTTSIQWAELARAAKAASEQAYAPYSKFPVGVAVQAKSGKIYSGCNVENASYGGTICAERNAIAAAIVAAPEIASSPPAIAVRRCIRSTNRPSTGEIPMAISVIMSAKPRRDRLI